MALSVGPLDGVKVVACSTAQAGTVPYMLMADLGAEVIKIELPGVGDNSRNSGQIPGFPKVLGQGLIDEWVPRWNAHE